MTTCKIAALCKKEMPRKKTKKTPVVVVDDAATKSEAKAIVIDAKRPQTISADAMVKLRQEIREDLLRSMKSPEPTPPAIRKKDTKKNPKANVAVVDMTKYASMAYKDRVALSQTGRVMDRRINGVI